MKEPKRNLAASVATRLLDRARRMGDDYQTLLSSFCHERFLYRLGVSSARDRFVLKGAMLLRLWSDQPYRATRDLDLLRRGDSSRETIRADVEAICAARVLPDGVAFVPTALAIEAIRPQDEYAGMRIILPAQCGSARLRLQIDIGIADAVWPPPRRREIPALLDFPPPEILAYPLEAVIAEKLEAVVVLGDRNSRIKDFFDLHHLAMHFAFDRVTLTEAVRRTFVRRHTRVPAEEPIGLTPSYWENPSRPAQVRAFVRRAGLTLDSDRVEEVLRVLRQFLLPILDDLRREQPLGGRWLPGGPWR
jgi:hypothetical protein